MNPESATFTLRDLNRQPAKVLEAVRTFGSAEIRTRSGEVFSIARKREAGAEAIRKKGPDFEQRRARMLALGYVPPSRSEFDEERFNRIIAGEE